MPASSNIAEPKESVTLKQRRYYEPVLDMQPGVQCQVDAGELRGGSVGGVETTVYFVVFVLSSSRLTYVGVSPQPIDTERPIRMYDAAFRAFGAPASGMRLRPDQAGRDRQGAPGAGA